MSISRRLGDTLLKNNIILFLIAIVSGIGLVAYAMTLGLSTRPEIIIGSLVFVIWVTFFIVVFFSSNKSHSSDSNKVEALEKKLDENSRQLVDLQDQLVAQEKMASIGALTAGIAHEIKNPLNFINNFSDMTVELIKELKEEEQKLSENASKETLESIEGIINEISTSCVKINEHGKRAESIVRNMLIQSRSVEGERTLCNINNLLEEYYNLAYHGMRAQNAKFNAKVEKHFDQNLPEIMVSSQNIGRVFFKHY